MEHMKPFEFAPQKLSREQLLKEMLPHMRMAYEKSQRVLVESAIKLEDFRDLYEGVVDRDQEWVERMEAGQSETDIHKMHADIIEAILFEHIEQSNWFGESATTIKTSKFDDIRNGIDIIVEFEEETNRLVHMGLAVDVTFGNTAAQNKIMKIKENIENGILKEVKYFMSERSPHKGLYRNLPSVVVGVDRLHLDELARMWTDDGRKREFAVHPVQMMILHEIRSQLMKFSKYAEQCGKKDIAAIYQKQLSMVQQILAWKSGVDSRTYEKSDSVHDDILRQLELF